MNSFVFFNFKKPTIFYLQKFFKYLIGEIAVFTNTNNSLNTALNYVKTKIYFTRLKKAFRKCL